MEQAELEKLLKDRGFGGLDDLPKVLDALDSVKADLVKNKTRAATVQELQQKLEEFEAAKRAAEDKEKTELQKLNDRLAETEAEVAKAKAAAASANRQAMLERGIAAHINTISEPLRPFATEHLRTVLPAKDWADEEALKTTIEESMKKFAELLPEHLKTVKSGETQIDRTKGGPPAGVAPIFDVMAAIHDGGTK